MKKIYILLLIIIYSVMAFSEDEEINLEISDDTISLNESINLKLELINLEDADDVKLYGIDKFNILNRSTSNYTSIKNSKKTVKKSINYIIQPQSEGNFSLEAKLTKDGKPIQSKKLEIKVSDKYNNKPNSKQLIDIDTQLSKKKVYFGEKVILKYLLYRRVNIDGKGFTTERDFDDFVVKKLNDLDSKTQYDRNGRAVSITEEVEKNILKPIKTGDIEIPSYNFQVNVVTSNDGFFSNTEPRYLRTDSKTIEVLPLPKPVPNNFDGIIGKPKITQSVSKSDIEYGDAVTIKISIEGNVNLDNLNQVIKNELDDFKIYESIKSDSESIKNDNYYAKKEFEIIAIPKKYGKILFPEMSIPYFNPETEKYEKLFIDQFEIDVKKSATQNINSSAINSSMEKVKINQISEKEMNNKYFVVKVKKGYVYTIIYIVVLIIFVLFLIYLYTKISRKDEYKTIYNKNKNAKSDEEHFEVLNQMVKYRYGVSIKSNSIKNISNAIFDENVYNEIKDIIEKYESKIKLNWKFKLKEIYRLTK